MAFYTILLIYQDNRTGECVVAGTGLFAYQMSIYVTAPTTRHVNIKCSSLASHCVCGNRNGLGAMARSWVRYVAR